jgi:hypothetical protein
MMILLVVAESYREACFYLRQNNLPVPPKQTEKNRVVIVESRHSLRGWLKDQCEIRLVGRYFLHQSWKEIEEELNIKKALGYKVYREEDLKKLVAS